MSGPLVASEGTVQHESVIETTNIETLSRVNNESER